MRKVRFDEKKKLFCSRDELRLAINREKEEHPWATRSIVMRIAKDHLEKERKKCLEK